MEKLFSTPVCVGDCGDPHSRTPGCVCWHRRPRLGHVHALVYPRCRESTDQCPAASSFVRSAPAQAAAVRLARALAQNAVGLALGAVAAGGGGCDVLAAQPGAGQPDLAARGDDLGRPVAGSADQRSARWRARTVAHPGRHHRCRTAQARGVCEPPGGARWPAALLGQRDLVGPRRSHPGTPARGRRRRGRHAAPVERRRRPDGPPVGDLAQRQRPSWRFAGREVLRRGVAQAEGALVAGQQVRHPAGGPERRRDCRDRGKPPRRNPGLVPRVAGLVLAGCVAGADLSRTRGALVAHAAGGADAGLPGADRRRLVHAAQTDAQRLARRRGVAHRGRVADRDGRFAGRGHPRPRPRWPPGLRQQDHGRHGGLPA